MRGMAEHWAKHINEKFSEYDLISFLLSDTTCPCESLDLHCQSCKYRDVDMEKQSERLGCVDSRTFSDIDIIDRIDIKKHIGAIKLKERRVIIRGIV